MRCLLDYYHQYLLNAPAKEAALFWQQRDDVTRGGAAPRARAQLEASFAAHLPGVPGNYFLQQAKAMEAEAKAQRAEEAAAAAQAAA